MAQHYYYDTKTFDFRGLLRELYGLEDLSLLHQLETKEYDIAGLGHDTHTDNHKKFFDKLHSGWGEFQEMYLGFVREVISPIVQEEFIFQQLPSYRIQLPNNKAVETWHYDSDEAHAHPFGERNFILPITEMKDTSAVWAESEPNKKDFAPLEGDFGCLIEFNGNQCTHGNKLNTTGRTRISFDFRVLPVAKYNPGHQGVSATSELKFIVGEYYRTL